MLLDQAVKEFLADLRLVGRAARTVEGHELELRRLDRWLADSRLDWRQLERRELQQYTRLRADKGHSSRANMLCSLRTFYRWSVEQGYVAMSPAAGFKTPRRPHPLPRALTLDQIRRLVAHLAGAAGRTARRDEALILTGLYAGLRAKELAGLRWPDVDQAGAVISIELSKMGRGRAVPIHAALGSLLELWWKYQALESTYVFSLDGRRLSPDRVGKVCRRVSVAVGFHFTAHMLRHSFATWTLRRSGNLYAVSKALGHAQVQQTEVYLSADVESVRGAVANLPEPACW